MEDSLELEQSLDLEHLKLGRRHTKCPKSRDYCINLPYILLRVINREDKQCKGIATQSQIEAHRRFLQYIIQYG